VAYNNWREKIKISYQAPLEWETENPEAIGEHGTTYLIAYKTGEASPSHAIQLMEYKSLWLKWVTKTLCLMCCTSRVWGGRFDMVLSVEFIL